MSGSKKRKTYQEVSENNDEWINELECSYILPGESRPTIVKSKDWAEVQYFVGAGKTVARGYIQIGHFEQSNNNEITIHGQWIYEYDDILEHCYSKQQQMQQYMEQINFEESADYALTEHDMTIPINCVVRLVSGLGVEFFYDLQEGALHRISDLNKAIQEAEQQFDEDKESIASPKQKVILSRELENFRDFGVAKEQYIWNTTYGKKLWSFIEPCLLYGYDKPDSVFRKIIQPLLLSSHGFPVKPILVVKTQTPKKGKCALCQLTRVLTHSIHIPMVEWMDVAKQYESIQLSGIQMGPECCLKLKHLMQFLEEIRKFSSWVSVHVGLMHDPKVVKKLKDYYKTMEKLCLLDRSKATISEDEEIALLAEEAKELSKSDRLDENKKDDIAPMPVSYVFPRKEIVDELYDASDKEDDEVKEIHRPEPESKWTRLIQSRASKVSDSKVNDSTTSAPLSPSNPPTHLQKKDRSNISTKQKRIEKMRKLYQQDLDKKFNSQ